MQDGTNLTCTMGEWVGEPTSYAYQWQVDGVAGATGTPLAVTAADNGKIYTCVVTATNANGVTAAPPSNAVTISGAAVTEAKAVPPHQAAPVPAPATPTRAEAKAEAKAEADAKHEAEAKHEQHGRMPARHDEPKGKKDW
jgi:hypothetical protein